MLSPVGLMSLKRLLKQPQPSLPPCQGYISHELQRSLEITNHYILLVRWQTLEDHTIGFRQSPEYQHWCSLLHHFYDPFPTVEHYEVVAFR